MDSGFAGGEDESYNVYDQPFRGSRDMASNIYRPSRNIDKDAYKDDFDTLMQNNRYRGTLKSLIGQSLNGNTTLYIMSSQRLSLWDCPDILSFSFSSCPPLGLSQTKTSWVPIMGKGGKGPFSLKRIPSVSISSWKKPSSTAAPRGPQQAAAPKTTTTTKNVGRSERQMKAAASMLAEVVCTLSVVEGCF